MHPWLSAVILGLIEGITEFLPISSTGHLLIPQNLGWLPKESDLFDVVIQSGAVLAVLAAFSTRVKNLASTVLTSAETRDYLLKLLVAFGITCAGGLVIKKLNVKLPENIGPVAWATLIGGIVILLVERWHCKGDGTNRIGWDVVIGVGLAQLLAALFPGTSRSGACIMTALALGMARPAATEFSFLLGIPTLVAAGGLKVWSALKEGTAGQEHWDAVLIGTIVSALSAFVVVKWLIRFVQSHTFTGFAYYRILLGVALLLLVRQGMVPAPH